MIRFSNKSSADVWMLDEHGRRLLDIIGEDARAASGIIRCDEIPAALERLRNAIACEVPSPSGEEDDEDAEVVQVDLRRRAYPLMEMLSLALKKRQDVLWGW